MQIPQWLLNWQQQLEAWSGQRCHPLARRESGWPPWHWKWKWPWHVDSKKKQELQEEYRVKKKQIETLAEAIQAESVADLQDVLGAMFLSECAYKNPDSELVRAVNGFRADFGGQLVSLHHVEPSLNHVPHRYLLAESGDTLFASFAGTKQYRDFMTDANILQGALFPDETQPDNCEEDQGEETKKALGLGHELPHLGNFKSKHNTHKPAAHRGFLARAKGIPAVELYRLAQKRDRKLVLCGHSLGGAVAVLATLAILRVFSTPSVSKSGGKLQVKCITFSQPPVGNAALRDYVHQRGWQQHFRTFCIPEDLVPRILSPAYFQHYRDQASDLANHQISAKSQSNGQEGSDKSLGSPDRMALGLGPLPKHLWRLPKLVPLIQTPRPFQWFKGSQMEPVASDGAPDSSQDTSSAITPLEIQEGTEVVGLTPLLSASEGKLESVEATVKQAPKDEGKDSRHDTGSDWLRRVPSLPSYGVPSLPSYVPFGQLYVLEKSSVQPLSASEYTQLISVQSVLQELKERFQSHTMRSYRLRFQKIYNLCMVDPSTSPALTMDHLPHLPHLQQWLGVFGAGMTEIGRISEPIIILTATAVVPLGWVGLPGNKQASKFMVDVQGYGLHLCTLVRAQINGVWCSTTVELLPPPPFAHQELQQVQPKLQRMRICIGSPLVPSPEKSKINAAEGTPSPQILEDSSKKCEVRHVLHEGPSVEVEGLGDVSIHCSTDFMTASQNVYLKLRRVRLLGLEGAGKTSLYFALLGQGGTTVNSSDGGVLPDMDWREGVSGGVVYVDPPGVNLQNMAIEEEHLRWELTPSAGHSGKKADLIILVHNLGHKIPLTQRGGRGGDSAQPQPVLGLLVDVAAAAGVPFILAITNKYAVSADRRKQAALTVMKTYKVSPSVTTLVNSCPYSVNGLANDSMQSLSQEDASKLPNSGGNGRMQGAAQRLLAGPRNFVARPFLKREVILPTDGVKSLRTLIHSVLAKNEEIILQELAQEQLALRTAEDLLQGGKGSAILGFGKPGTVTAAAVGAAFGAGFGVFVTLVIGAAAALRKP